MTKSSGSPGAGTIAASPASRSARARSTSSASSTTPGASRGSLPTARQLATLRMIRDLWPAPTYRELGNLLGTPGGKPLGLQAVRDHVEALAKKGLVSGVGRRKARMLEVTSKGRRALATADAGGIRNARRLALESEQSRLRGVPMVACTFCGRMRPPSRLMPDPQYGATAPICRNRSACMAWLNNAPKMDAARERSSRLTHCPRCEGSGG